MFYGFNKVIGMRFKLRRSSLMMMHNNKGMLMTVCCIVAVQCILISETEGLTNVRLKAKQSPSSTTTTAIPSTFRSSLVSTSTELTTRLPSASLSPNTTRKGRRRRLRVKKLGVNKRQGELEQSQEVQNVSREPLYKEHADEIAVPDHYYSPIKRQRMRQGRLFNQGLQEVNQQFHNSLQESTPKSDPGYSRIKGIKNRELEVDPNDPRANSQRGHPIHDYSEDFVAQTQPPPKNYAFAYAVRDRDNAEDFSHKEARDGKLTKGEYRTSLPDGRTQVVRYTAGGNSGYKADIHYESDQENPGISDAASSTPTYRPRQKRPRQKNNQYYSPSPTPVQYREEKTYSKYGVPREKEPRRRQKYGSPQRQDRRPKYGVPQAPIYEKYIRPEEPKQEYGRPEEPKREYGRPEEPKIEYGRPEEPRREYGRPKEPKQEYGQPEEPKQEYGRPKEPKQEYGRPEEPKQEYGRPEEPRREYGRPKEPKQEYGRPKEPKQEYGRPQEPKREYGRPQEPKREYGRPQEPKREYGRPQEPKIEYSRPQEPKLEYGQPEEPKQEYGQPEEPKQEYGQPEKPKQEYGQPEEPKQEYGQPEEPKQEYGQPEEPKQEYGQPEEPKQEYGQPKEPKQEYGRPEEPKQEYGRPEEPRREYGQPKEPKQEYGRPEEPKREYGRPQEPKREYGRPEQPKIEYGRPQEPKIEYSRPQEPKIKYGRPQEPKKEYGRPQEPKIEYGRPEEPKIEYGRPQEPKREYGRPAEPKQEYGRPEEPKREYGRPEEPRKEYGRPKEPRKEYGKPEEPKREYGQPEEPRREYGRPKEPRREYGRPKEPKREYGRPEEPIKEYDRPDELIPAPRYQREPPKHGFSATTPGYHREIKPTFSSPSTTAATRQDRKYKYPTSSPTPSYFERDDTSYDKYDGPKVPFSHPQPTTTPTPVYRTPGPTSKQSYVITSAPSPSPLYYSDNKDVERPRRPKPSPPSPKYGRPKSIYNNIPEAQKKEFDDNLNLLHDQSPRAGPDRQKSGGGGGGYNFFPGQQELEKEIDTIKKNYNPTMFDYNAYNAKKAKKKKTSQRVTMAPPDLYNEPGPGNYYSAVSSSPPPPPPSSTPQYPKYPKPVYRTPSPTPTFNYIDGSDDQGHTEVTPEQGDQFNSPPASFGTFTPINFKSQGKELIPIENFKAGPARKQISVKDHPVDSVDHFFDAPTQRPQSYSTRKPKIVRYKEPFYYYNSQHPNYHHGGYNGPTQKSVTESLPAPSPPDAFYTIDFPGGRHSFYLKTSSGSTPKPKQQEQYEEPEQQYHFPTPRPPEKKKHTSGLIYFKTPAVGPRPTDLGVKHVLDQLPNMPQSHSPNSVGLGYDYPHTTVHPYEVGSKDYGHSVSYKNSFNTPSSADHDDNDHHDHNEQHDQDHHEDDHSSTYPREFLIDNSKDTIIPTKKRKIKLRPNIAPSTPEPPPLVYIQQYHYQKTPSPSPLPALPIAISTPESLQDIVNQQYLQSTPTPAFSSTFFNQPIAQNYSKASKLSIDPRNANAGGASIADLGLNAGGEQPAANFYQYEGTVQ